jgi:hypothetical protein
MEEPNMKQGKIVDIYGNIFYYKDDQLHSEKDLPAIIYTNETKCWYLNGERHRLSGPAKITAKGAEWYFINSIQFTKEAHANHPLVKKYKLQQILNRLTA